jgi:hypothetical protein
MFLEAKEEAAPVSEQPQWRAPAARKLPIVKRWPCTPAVQTLNEVAADGSGAPSSMSIRTWMTRKQTFHMWG